MLSLSHKWSVVVRPSEKGKHRVYVTMLYGGKVQRARQFTFPNTLAPRVMAERALKKFIQEA